MYPYDVTELRVVERAGEQRAHGCCVLWSRLIGPHYTPLLRHLPRRSTCPPYNYPATSHRHQTSAEQGYFCNTQRVDLSNTLLFTGIEKRNKQQICFRKITRLCEAIATRYHQEFNDIWLMSLNHPQFQQRFLIITLGFHINHLPLELGYVVKRYLLVVKSNA